MRKVLISSLAALVVFALNALTVIADGGGGGWGPGH